MNEVTMEDVIQAIGQELKRLFPKAQVYEELEQGYIEPCFFIDYTKDRIKKLLGNRYENLPRFRLVYFQDFRETEAKYKAYQVRDSLNEGFDIVTYKGMHFKIKDKEIEIQEISIQKEDRFLIEIYMEKSNITDIDYIEKILTDVLKEKIVLNQEASIGTRLNFLSDDKFVMAIGNSEITKSNSDISGDSFLSVKLKDGKYLVALSDGMGSGEDARQSSNKALKMLENLLLSGFDKKTSLELINSSLINQNEEIFATLDIAIIDLYKGNIEFIKSGACPTYIKKGDKVQILKANSLPAGIVPNAGLQVYDRDVDSGEILLMCTDGVLDSNVEYKNKELWLRYVLEDIETTNTKKIADLVLNEAIDNCYGVAKDDMSVLVCRFLRK